MNAGAAGTNEVIMCQNTILSKKNATIISQCLDCKMIMIWHGNALFYFSPDQFRAFKRFTENLDVTECLFTFPDNEERLILCTPNRDINFNFSLEEWEGFHAALAEAAYMQDVYELVYPE